MAKNIVPRSQNYPQWYLDVIKAADLADYSPVRGCMVIKPNGYAIWEAIKAELDRRFKDTGHENAYFPLFIPEHFMKKEAEHVEGFAPELAVVTHGGGKKLEEPLVVRPTSETVIGAMYSKWIQSYRDLPVLINQWANVVRWEMRTRLFLRTSEFLWQEGHTAHATREEAEEETARMLQVYRDFVEDFLAVPVLAGEKTETERFAGAEKTYTIEGMMQDGKALQMGTSHFLGQNFAKAFDIKFEDRDHQLKYAWTTSWGVSTRLIGAIIMVHSDDEGLILPPKVAPTLAAVIPIFRTPQEREIVEDFARKVIRQIVGEEEFEGAQRRISRKGFFQTFISYFGRKKLVMDLRDARPGEKHYYWEQQGTPFRIEVGPRDVKNNSVVVKTRLGDRFQVSADELDAQWLRDKAGVLQKSLYERALKFREEHTTEATTYEELKEILSEKGGFVIVSMTPDREKELRLKEETKATVRLILGDGRQPGKDIFDGTDARFRVVIAQSY